MSIVALVKGLLFVMAFICGYSLSENVGAANFSIHLYAIEIPFYYFLMPVSFMTMGYNRLRKKKQLINDSMVQIVEVTLVPKEIVKE